MPMVIAQSVPGESVMSVKIRISFTEDEELAGVIRLLSPALKSHKVSGKKEGKYRNAYADLDGRKLVDLNLDAH